MNRKNITLTVDNAFMQDVGYQRARLDVPTRKELDLSIGDTIVVTGKKPAKLIVWRAHPMDENKNSIRIDSFVQDKIGIKAGDKIKVQKAKEALLPKPVDNNVIRTKIMFKKLTDEERMEVMSDYCRSCGCDNPDCQCWNDE